MAISLKINIKWIKFFIKLSLTIVILWLLIYMVGWSDIQGAFVNINWCWLSAMYFLVILVKFAEAGQMTRLLLRINVPVSLMRVFLANMLAVFYSLFLPGDLVASGVKWHNLSVATGERSIIFSAMIYNRLALILPMMLIGGIALVFEDPFYNPLIKRLLFIAIAILLLMALSLFSYRLSFLIERSCLFISSFLPEFISRKIQKVRSSLILFHTLTIKDHIRITKMGLLAIVLSICATIMGYKALGIEVPILAIIYIHAVTVAIRQLPITINSLGVREGLLIFMLSYYGVSPELAIAVGMLKFSSSIIQGSVGGIYQLLLVLGWVK